jgi:hypothetical protein
VGLTTSICRDTLKSPNREVGDRSFQPTREPPSRLSQIPQPGGWGSFIPAYKRTAFATLSNPPIGRLGIVHSSLQENRLRDSLKSPNREVGDRSFQPTREPSSRLSQIPQPEGWGSFIPAYKRTVFATLSNPPTGRLGIVHSSLQENRLRDSLNPPTGRLGIVHSSLQENRLRDSLKSPNRKVGDRSFQPTREPSSRLSQIPQPEGWGSFIPAYKDDARETPEL